MDSRDPIGRVARALRDTNGHVLALDSGTAELGARYRAEAAVRERIALERRRFKWLPGRGPSSRRRASAEVVAVDAAVQTRRIDAEVRHGARSFVDARGVATRRDEIQRKIADRATERLLQRGRRIGREL